MSVVTRYLNRMVAWRIAAAFIAISLFALLFDLLEASDDLIRKEGNLLVLFGQYILLRMPSLVGEVLPFAALVGALFAAVDLLRNSELTIFWASGLSPLGVVTRLLPVGLIILGLKLANDELLVPDTVETLRDWRVGLFKRSVDGFSGEDLWVRHEESMVRLPRLDAGSLEAAPLLILRLDDEGKLVERIAAASATLEPGSWELRDVERGRVGEGRFVHEPLFVWDNHIDVEKLRLFTRPPQELGIRHLLDIVANDGYGVTTTHAYRSALYHRLASAAVPMLLVMLVFALARRAERQGAIGRLFLGGISGGFVYIIASGLLLALAEAGFLTPLAATAAPVLVLLLFILLLPVKDRLRLRRHAG